MTKKRIPISEAVEVKQVRPQPTTVRYEANPEPSTERIEIEPGETLEEAQAREKATREAIESRTLEDLRREDNQHNAGLQPLGKRPSLPARIIGYFVATLIGLIAIGLLFAALAIIVWFIGWLVFGAW